MVFCFRIASGQNRILIVFCSWFLVPEAPPPPSREPAVEGRPPPLTRRIATHNAFACVQRVDGAFGRHGVVVN